MQKLILGRSFSLSPKFILACQPTRGLDIGAVAYVHERILSARGERAAILLISDDLDEILSLSDRVAVIYRGRISKPLPRAEVTIKEIGLIMAGHGFAGEAHAA
jgi:simple sugar transport system ATP-binding protein